MESASSGGVRRTLQGSLFLDAEELLGNVEEEAGWMSLANRITSIRTPHISVGEEKIELRVACQLFVSVLQRLGTQQPIQVVGALDRHHERDCVCDGVVHT